MGIVHFVGGEIVLLIVPITHLCRSFLEVSDKIMKFEHVLYVTQKKALALNPKF